MKRPSDIKIDCQHPWANDDLKRKPQGVALANFLQSLSSSYVIAVKAPWGAGKSTFLSRLGCHLQYHIEPTIPVVRLDAWRSDYLEDPLIAFGAALQVRLEELPGKLYVGRRIGKEIVKKATKLAGTAAEAAVKYFVPGGELAVSGAKGVGKLMDAFVKDREDHAKTVKEFSAQLEEARDVLTGRVKGGLEKPIVFMVDELDRCRPDFAIRLLERIKHFFDVKGIIFLIATDGLNLPAAVKSVFGPDQDSERYLRKFIDYEFRLPDPTSKDFIKYLCTEYSVDDLFEGESLDTLQKAMIEKRYEYSGNGFSKKYVAAEAISVFPTLAEHFRLTLRDQIQAFAMITATIRAAPDSLLILARLMVLCVCLRFFKDGTAFEALVNGEMSLSSLLGSNISPVQSYTKKVPLNTYFSVLDHVLKTDAAQKRGEYLGNLMSNNNLPTHEVFPMNSLNLLATLPANYLQLLLGISSAFGPQPQRPGGSNAQI